MITLLFDVDDTLYDRSVPFQKACEVFLGEISCESAQRLYQAFTFRGNEVFAAAEAGQMPMEESHVYRITMGMQDCGHTFTREMALHFQRLYARNQREIRLSDTVKVILDECREKGVPMGIITNGPLEHQTKKAEDLGLAKWIPEEHWFISGEMGYAKPDRRVFQYVKEAMKLSETEVYMIGDSYSKDIAGAMDAGWHTIWLNRKQKPLASDVRRPDYTVYKEEELKLLVHKLIER